MVWTEEKDSRCNPIGYHFVSTLRPKVLWRRLLGYGPHFPAEEQVSPPGTTPGDVSRPARL